MPVPCLPSLDPEFKKAWRDHSVLLLVCDKKDVKVHGRYVVYQSERKRWAVYTNRETHHALVGRFDHLFTAVFKANQRSW
jgi:hypothetical protein